MDLVGDYAGQELFVVEGDSLLLRCFSDPRLDFDGECSLIGHSHYFVRWQDPVRDLTEKPY